MRKRQSVFVLAYGDRERTRLLAALAPAVHVRLLVELDHLPPVENRDCLVLTVAAANSKDTGVKLRVVRQNHTVVIIYSGDMLLEASLFFDDVDGWASFRQLEQQPKRVLEIAKEGYAIYPNGLDPVLGLDTIRFRRLATLPDQDLTVLSELGSGATNREIARRLDLPEQAVASSIRRSMTALCVRNRLQAAILRLRYERHSGSFSNDGQPA